MKMVFNLLKEYKKAEFLADSEYDEKNREKINSFWQYKFSKWTLSPFVTFAKVFCKELISGIKILPFLKKSYVRSQHRNLCYLLRGYI